MEVINLQRQRISNLENEYDALYEKYEYVMKKNFITAEESIAKILDKQLKGLKDKNIDDNLQSVVQDYAKQISTLKAKITEQGAQILLNKDDIATPTYGYPRTVHKSGAVKRPSVSQRQLAPLRDTKSSSLSSEYSQQSYEYTKSGNITQFEFCDLFRLHKIPAEFLRKITIQ